MSKNNNYKAIQFITFVCVLIINMSTLSGGIRDHENWRIVLGSISLTLMCVAAVLLIVKMKKESSTPDTGKP